MGRGRVKKNFFTMIKYQFLPGGFVFEGGR